MKGKIISDLGDRNGPYITSQASDADASYGMAGVLRCKTDKADALDKLSDQAAHILEHMIKLQCYPNHEAARQWRAEINAQATRLVRFSRGKKGRINFTEKDFLKIIYQERISDTPILEILETYGPFQVQPSPEKLREMVRMFSAHVLELTKEDE